MKQLVYTTLACVITAGAFAQTPAPSPAPAARDELEPGVNTSAPAATPAPAPQPAAPAAAAPQRPAAPRASTPAAGTPNNPAAAAPRKGNARDRLDLESTQITGNRELPKVLYIVPWRNAQLGDLVGRPVNSLLDEVLEPVDRDVFRRTNRYFDALQPNDPGAPGNSGNAPAPQTKP
jgi:hypothetical protein